MKIPMMFGTLHIAFETDNPMILVVRREVNRVLCVNGKADRNNRIPAIKKLREMTGCGLFDAVKYTNKFFPPSERVGV